MALMFHYHNRLVIPIWRRFSDAVKLNELSSTDNSINIKPDISTIISDWSDDKNIITASEVINAALTITDVDFQELKEAKDYLEKSKYNSVSLPLKSINELINKNNTHNDSNQNIINKQFDLLLEDINVENINDIWKRINFTGINEAIGALRQLSQKNLYNPVVWVEMSRMYLIQGHVEKADKAMRIALSIAPNNKFVLRASTSLYVNIDDSERAIYHLRKSPRTKYDPWLVSAHIAASRVINRYSPLIKNGFTMINSKDFSPLNLTELASSIGTEEYKSGGLKKAKEFFNIALKRPNDNTLAQIEWVSQLDNKFNFNPSKYKKLILNPFEANALDALENEHWNEAVINGAKWFLETPYNVNSARFIVFMLTALFNQHNDAIEFCKAAIRIHPDDHTVVNNLVYCHIIANRTQEIKSYVNKFLKTDFSMLSMENKVAYAATLGLLHFRSGRHEEGRSLYKRSIELAQNAKMLVSIALASTNLLREEYYAGIITLENCLDRLEIMKKETIIPIVLYTIEASIKEVKKHMQGFSKGIID